jgi:PAS domain S-box-containing protein
MNLKKLFSIVFAFQTVLVICLGVLTLILFRNQTNLNKSQNVHIRSVQLVDELRQSSDDLTRMARAYVATGNPEFEREYWAVLDIRNGKIPRPIDYNRIYWDFVSGNGQKPRPDGETVSLRDLMIREGFTKAELEKMNEAQKNSDGLVTTERIAMHAVKGLFDDGKGNFTIKRKPDCEMASRIMNDDAYYKTKAAIMKPLDEFFAMFEKRTEDDIARYERDANYVLWGIIALIAILMIMLVASYIIIQRQITKRLSAEDKLKIYEKIFNSINDVVNITDLNDNIILANPAFCRTYGYSEEEVIGKNLSIFRAEQLNSKDMIEEILPSTLDGGWNGEIYNKRKDGTEFPIHLSTAVIKNDRGVPIASVAVVQDITKAKESELLKNSLYEIADAVNQTTDIDSFYCRIHEIVKVLMPADNFFIALYDPESDMLRFPYFRDGLYQLQHFPKGRSGRSDYVLRTGEPIIIDKALADELCRTGKIDSAGSNSKVWLGVPLKISGNTIGVMVVQDYKNKNAYTDKEKQILVFVSEHVASAIYKKRTEEKLKLYAEELLVLNNSKDKFFSIIAHDLKSPFLGFLGLTKDITQNAGNISPQELAQLGSTMYQAADNLFKFLQNLLEWAQMQSGSISLIQNNILLSELISKNVEVMKDRSNQKGITINNLVTDNIYVYADEKMINSVLMNLISNAVKFTYRNGTVTLSAKNTEDQMIEISIRDTGIGMPKTMGDRLFELGEKTGRQGTDGELSTGLGLLLCKEFVNKNGGRIWVESEEGVGSTFSFTLHEISSVAG